uniref:Alpha-1 adrenergic receptor n=1 Tax=Platynereis dumerilii TaxID=6359 RepID=A0A1J0F5Z2_PLADU|nr:alpha-1 adrenergic receptor [Platynereis dumerilii]
MALYPYMDDDARPYLTNFSHVFGDVNINITAVPSPTATRVYDVTLNPDDVTFNYSGFNLTDRNITIVQEKINILGLIGMTLSGVTLGTIVLMTVCGNVLVLLAVFVNSHLRSTTNFFIVNLAIADLLLGTLVLPFSASLEIVNYWAFGQLFCDIWAAVDVLCCTASIMSLCVISIDRYIGVTRPLQHSTIVSEKRAFYTIISVWLLSSAISVAPLLGWKDPPNPDPRVCEVTKQLGYVLFSVAGSFYIPLAIILIVYFRVYREALLQSRCLATGMKTAKANDSKNEITLRIHTGKPSKVTKPSGPGFQSSSSSEHSEGSSKKNNSKLTLAGKMAKFKREKKAAKTLGIVVGVFILCWFPFFFILPLEALCEDCHIPGWLFKIIFWLGYCNSMMNPIIYACSSREFKRAFIRILRCQWRRRPRTFLDVDVTAGGSSTEMNKIGRVTFRNFTRRSNRDLERSGEAATRLLRSSMNGARSSKNRFDGDSPIASLRFLHNQTRHLSTVSDDDDSSHHDDDASDDERSDNDMPNDLDNPLMCSDTPINTNIPLQESLNACVKSSVKAKSGPHCSPLIDPSCKHSSKTKNKSSMKPQIKLSKRWPPIPDIIIDDVSQERRRRRSNGQTTSEQRATSKKRSVTPISNYNTKEERIMWL